MKNLQDLMLLAESDEQINDMSQFTRFVELAHKAQKIEHVPAPVEKQVIEPKDFTFTFSAEPGGLVSNYPNKEAPSVSKDKLLQHPNEALPNFRIYNDDTITLQTYRKMGRDADLALGTLILIGLVSSLKFEIHSANREMEAVVRDLYKPHHNKVVRSLIRSGVRDGFAFAEKVWELQQLTSYYQDGTELEQAFEGQVYGLKKVKFVDPTLDIHFYKRRSTDELVWVEQYQKGMKKRVRRDRLVWFAMDREYSSVFGESRFKKAYSSWYYGKLVDQYELNHLQKVGSPTIEARYPTGSTPMADGNYVPNDQIIKQVARNLMANGSFSLPSDKDENGEYYWTLEYKEPKNNSVTPYTEFKERNKNKKYRALGILAQLVSDANFSDTDAKLTLQMISMEDLIDQLQDTIKQDIIDWLVKYNFGPNAISQVHFHIDRSSLNRGQFVRDVILKALTIGSSYQGYIPNDMPDLGGALRDIGMGSVPFDSYFTKDPNAQVQGFEGRTPLGRENNNNESNRQRDSPDDRERGRATEGNRGRD